MSKYRIFVVYKDIEDYKRISENIPKYVDITYVNIGIKAGKSLGWSIKNHYSAIKDPFIIVLDWKPIVGFYAEDLEKNPIDRLFDFLKIKPDEHN